MNDPMIGITPIMFVITVAAQKLICPQGSTEPRKAVPDIKIKIVTPEYHTLARGERKD
jgi:hypothetical protein